MARKRVSDMAWEMNIKFSIVGVLCVINRVN